MPSLSTYGYLRLYDIFPLRARAFQGWWSSMNFGVLSGADLEIIGQSLRAAADGPFFPDWEFHTLFGLERCEIRRMADEWPHPSASTEDLTTAVNNSLNNLLGYPHGEDAVWPQWISIGPEQLKELYKRLRGREDERYSDLLA